jgi:hypothetical protein
MYIGLHRAVYTEVGNIDTYLHLRRKYRGAVGFIKNTFPETRIMHILF